MMLPVSDRRALHEGVSRYARLMQGAVSIESVMRWPMAHLSEMLDILAKQLAEEHPS